MRKEYDLHGAKRGVVVKDTGKQRITIMLDCDILSAFLAETGEEIVIIKRGRLVPCREPPEAIFGADRDIIRIHGDVVEPLDVEWEAEVDPD